MKGFNRNTNTYRILILVSSNILLQLMGFAYRMMLNALAGTEALGLHSLVMQVYAIAVSVCISGMSITITANAARFAAMGHGAIRSLTKKAFKLYLLLFAMLLVPVLLLKDRIAAKLIGDAGTEKAITLILICIFLTGIENMFKALNIGTGNVKTTAVSEICELMIRFGCVSALLKHCSDGTDSGAAALIILGMVLSEVFSVCFLTASYFKRYGGEKPNPLPALTGEIIKTLVPASFTAIAGTVFTSASALILPGRLIAAGYTRALALRSIGILSAAVIPVIAFPMAFIKAVSSVFMPAIAESAGKAEAENKRRIVRRSMGAAVFASSLTLAFLPLLPLISKLLFGISPLKGVFALYAVNAVIINFRVICEAVLNGMMKQKAVLLYSVMGDIIRMILIYFLSALPELHIFGYIFSMAAGEGVCLLLSFRAIKKELGICPLNTFGTFLAAAACLIILLYANAVFNVLKGFKGEIVQLATTAAAVCAAGGVCAALSCAVKKNRNIPKQSGFSKRDKIVIQK